LLKKKLHKPHAERKKIVSIVPDISTGLTSEQVQDRVDSGAVNVQKSGLTPSIPKILLKNVFTLFNMLCLFLAIVLLYVGRQENMLFLGIAITSTIMGIIQELRAKNALDKLAVLAKAHVTVVRDGKKSAIPQDKLVIDDIMLLIAGNQICVDANIIETEGLETDESLLTGETDKIRKNTGDKLFSGSFVASGQAYACVSAVGDDSFANSITNEAKQSKKNAPRLLKTLNRIIHLTIVLLPLGILLFYSDYARLGLDNDTAALGAATAIISMIPAGLILLTGVTLTVGALKLAKQNTLVQSLHSIETLARTNVLCLDKTGTITDGSIIFDKLEINESFSEDDVKLAIASLMGTLEDKNATANAISEAFGVSYSAEAIVRVPFSSDRKWSGATYEKGSFIIGAPNIVLKDSEGDFQERANTYASEGLRVLCLAYSENPIVDETLPEELECMSLIIFSDNIRENASETFKYFAEEKVDIKVISGDNPRTVSAVAAKAGLAGSDKAIDMSTLGNETDYSALTEEYTVFGHTSPQQKKALIVGLKKNGHTVCMTGDGVNDILAMRESDCSIAMVAGSDAARAACDFVLMSDNFGAMVDVLKEGRRVINNIEKVAAVFLLQTVYSLLLTIIYIFLPYQYPVTLRQMTPVGSLTVGIPTFFLALQANYSRPSEKLIQNMIEHTLPAAITIVFNTLYIQAAAVLFDLPVDEYTTMVVFLIGIVGFYLLMKVSLPYTDRIKMMLALLALAFIVTFTVTPIREFFNLYSLFNRNAFFYLPLIYFSYHVHDFFGKACRKALEAYRILKSAGWMKTR